MACAIKNELKALFVNLVNNEVKLSFGFLSYHSILLMCY